MPYTVVTPFSIDTLTSHGQVTGTYAAGPVAPESVTPALAEAFELLKQLGIVSETE